MYNLEFILFDLLNLEYLSDIALIDIDEFSVFLRVLVGLIIEESLVVFFVDEEEVVIAHDMGEFDLWLDNLLLQH